MQQGISNKNKQEIFSLILSQQDPFKADEYGGIIEFLNTIWDLKSMPSEDSRFKDAEGDVIQHTINNDDWEIDYLFKDRLQLFKSDETFIRFIETVVSPQFRSDEDDILKFVLLINEILELDGLQLSISEYSDNGHPIYTAKELDENDTFPIDVKRNTIPFFVIEDPDDYYNVDDINKALKSFPCFALVFNAGWNDFGRRTEFRLFYHDAKRDKYEIQAVKILSKGSTTIEGIPREFTQLGDEFCSLGQYLSFYEELKELLRADFLGVLFALRDAAFFPEIQEEFENVPGFRNSLIRYDEPERVLREV